MRIHDSLTGQPRMLCFWGKSGIHLVLSALSMWGLAVPVQAVDLEWNNTSGLLFYDTATNWNPVNAPDDTDNIFFNLNETLTIILGAPSNGNNFTVTAGDWTFTGGSGTSLDTEGVVTIDDASMLTGAGATLVGPSNWDNVGNAVVGDAGFGLFNINSGADFQASNVIMGNVDGSTGVINVDGVGSLLTADATGSGNGMFIGNAGSGVLNVTGGAIARTLDVAGIPDFNIGMAATGEGTLNIDGAGSQAVAEDMFVGYAGTGHMNITNGGVMNQTINTSPDAWVGYSGPASSGDITVYGDNSAWNMRNLFLGNNGAGTLDIEAGGKVVASGIMTIGVQATADASTTVTGSGTNGSLLQIASTLIVGQFGKGTLNAELGGDITVGGAMYVGDDISNTNDNAVTITNAGSSLAVTGVLYVGNEGKGSLDVTDGASLTAGDLRVAQNTGSTGDMKLQGGSTAYISNGVAVGNDSTGTLLIDTASVMNVDDTFWVGFDNGSGTVTVNGSGSELNVNNSNLADVYIGGENAQTGGTGVVNIENGALFTTQRSVFIGGNATGDGTVNVTGPGSDAEFYDNGDVSPGAANEVTYIGYNGAGALNITDGGHVRNELVRIGEGTGSAAADVLVSGVNLGALPLDPGDDTPSTWNIWGDIVVGTSRKATLTIADGAIVTSQTGPLTANSYIGYGAASDGSNATVTGAGSKWLHEHFLFVGNYGGNSTDPAALNVLDGGLVEATYIPMAVQAGSYGVINVDGADSTLHLVTNAKSTGIGDIRMVVGTSNGTAIINVTGGGLVDLTTNLEIGRGAASGNATVNVSGADSLIDAAGELTVAYDNSTGILNVSDGGSVVNEGNAYISRLDGNGTANIGAAAGADTGHAQASWTIGTPSVSANLYISGSEVGNAGANIGTLNVNPTGKTTVHGLLRVWNRGIVNLNGGTLEFETIDLTDSSSIIVTDPTFNFNSGTARFLAAANLTSAILTPMLGATQTLAADQHLAVVGATTLSTALRLNGGTFSVGSIAPASIANLDFDAGTFNLTASNLVVGAGGQFGSTLNIDADQAVNVTLNATIDAGSQLVVLGGFSSGGLTNHGDTLFIDTTGSGKAIDGSIITPAGSTITVVGDITFNDAISGAGQFYGPGNAIFAGGYSPGDSPAAVHFEGDVTFATANTLSVEIGGTTAGADYDQVNADGDVTVAGKLDLLPGFTPAFADTFTILTGSSVSGTFDTIDGIQVDSNLALAVTYGADAVTVTAALPGDANLDGQVNLADLQILGDNWLSTTARWSLADFTGDGNVTLADLQILGDHWGGSTADLAAFVATIPEPGCALLLVGVTGLIATRRKTAA